jgi:hypothetical protein
LANKSSISYIHCLLPSLEVDLYQPHEGILAVVSQVTGDCEVTARKEVGLYFLSKESLISVLEVFLFLLFVIVSHCRQQVIIILAHLSEITKF